MCRGLKLIRERKIARFEVICEVWGVGGLDAGVAPAVRDGGGAAGN